MTRLKGKTAFVTGGGSGIGRATALRLADEGAKVAVVDLREQAALETTEQIEKTDGEALGVRCDVPWDVKAAIERSLLAPPPFSRREILLRSLRSRKRLRGGLRLETPGCLRLRARGRTREGA